MINMGNGSCADGPLKRTDCIWVNLILVGIGQPLSIVMNNLSLISSGVTFLLTEKTKRANRLPKNTDETYIMR